MLVINARPILLILDASSLYGFGLFVEGSVLGTILFYFHNLYTVWIWLILIKVTYTGRVSEMFQIKCVDIIISTLLWHCLDCLDNLLLP